MRKILDFYTDGKEDFDENEAVYEEDINPEVVEMVEELKNEGKASKGTRFFQIVSGLMAIVSVCSMLYIKSLYLPEDRQFDMANMFTGSDVCVSDHCVNSVMEELLELGYAVDEENMNYLLLNAIHCNDNLTDEEKEFCCGFIDIFNDNPYLDKERVYHSLLNLDISYKNRPYIYEDSVEGVYIDKYKSIGVFVNDPDKAVLGHEIIHCICANDGSLPTFFVEGMTELLANEYLSDSPFIEFKHYPFEIYAVKMLCDTAGSDVVLKAYTTGNMDLIYEALASYSGTVDDAKKAIGIFEKLFLFLDGKNENLDFNNEEMTNDLFMYLNSVANNKYGDNSEEFNFDRSSYYYNQILFLNIFDSKSKDAISADLEELGVFCKPYFSSKLKAEYCNPTIGILDNATVVNEHDIEKVKVK